MEQQWAAVEQQREAETAEREQEAARQREAMMRREQETADPAMREVVRQHEAAAEMERVAAKEKPKAGRPRRAVMTVEEILAERAAEAVAWVRERKALAGQWNEEKAAVERQAKQEKEAWETSRPGREAAERARRAWHIESNPAFETLSMRERRVMVNLWDKRFPMRERIEKPAERERRIEEVSTKMNRDAFHSRELALDRPKREAMLERLISRQPEQQQERTRDPGPTKDYGLER